MNNRYSPSWPNVILSTTPVVDTATPQPKHSPLRTKLAEIVKEHTGYQYTVSDSDTATSLGMDSLDQIEFLMHVEEEFGWNNRTYHVKKVDVYSSVYYVELVEIPGKKFNTVLFK